MFNRVVFNQVAYNRPSESFITVVSSIGNMMVDCVLVMSNRAVFNQAAFNRTAYNRLSEGFITVVSSIGNITADCGLVMYSISNLDAGSELVPQAIRIMPISYVGDGFGDTDLDLVRVYMQDAALGSLSALYISGRRATQFVLQFLGSVNPNDVVEIDTERMTATINGQNALHFVDGRFWELVVGRNTVRYTDNETSRQVELIVVLRDRWL